MAKKDLPKTVKAFVQHGVYISDHDEDEAVGTCPFCGKQKHFYIDVSKQLWKCMAGKCGKHGNFKQFMRRRMEHYREAIEGQPLKALAMHRKISKATLTRWGVGYDPKSRMYMIPLTERGVIVDIHRYSTDTKNSIATATARGGFFMIAGDPDLHDTVVVCEGQWDTYAFDEALRDADVQQAVIGVAGANRIPKVIAELLTDKHVVLAFDYDKAGAQGDERCRKLLGHNPKSIKSVHWSDAVTTEGYDIRDLWIDSKRDGSEFFKHLKPLIKSAPVPIPSSDGEESADDGPPETATTEVPVPTGKGVRRKEVIDGYRKWLYMPDTDILDIAFGTAFANRLPGDPLWLFLVGPPGSLKTEIIQSFGDAMLTSLETDITRQSLVSGMQTLSGNDPSLIPAWNGRTVLIADFTTILAMNQVERDAIFGIFRSAYDGRYEKKFGNGVKRVYRSHFGMLCGVTPTIEKFGSTHSVLGERFVKYYIKGHGRIQQGSQAIMTCINNLNKETQMREELRALAKRALDRKVDTTKPPEIHDEVKKRFYLLAQWAAAMRGAVSRDKYTQDVLHHPVTEIGTRLVKQLAKLAQGITMFRRKKVVGFDEFRIVAQVARDSAPDRVESIVHHLYLHSNEGWFNVDEITDLVKLPKQTVTKLLQDMVMLHLVRVRKPKGALYPQYRLSSSMVQTMQPLDLYAKEAQWRRATRKKEKPKTTKPKPRKKVGRGKRRR